MSWWKNDPLAEATTTSKWWEADPVVSIDLPEEEPAPRFAQERGLGVPEPVAAKKPKMVIEPFDASKHKPRDLGLGGESTEILITEDAPDGGYWNIPTVWWNDKGEPRVFSREEAQQIASMYEAETGKKFPRFSSPEEGVTAAQSRSNAGGGQGSALATRRQAQIDSTDDARAERGFGRSAYLDDGMTPNLPTNTPVRDITRTASAEPRQPISDLGKRAARGATEVAASFPEAVAVGQSAVASAAQRGAEQSLVQRDETIARFDEILRQPDLTAEKRTFYEAQKAAYLEGQKKLKAEAAKVVTPASEQPDFARGDKLRNASLELFGTPDPQFDDRFLSQLSEGAGNMAGFVAVTLLTGPLGGAAAGSGLNTSSMYREALEYGASEQEARQAAYIGSIIGASEVLPIGRALGVIPDRLKPKIANALARRVASALKAGGEEAAQEALAQVANNWTAQGIFDPDRKLSEGALEGAVIGGILGGALGGIASSPAPVATDRFTPNDRERINSPRLTENDRKSPIPNDIIDDGKAAIDDLLSGKVPSGAVPMDTLYGKPVAPLDEAAPNVRTPTPEAVQRPLPTDRLSPTLGAAPQADTLPQRPEATVAPTAPVAATERTFEDLPEEDGDVPTGRTIRVYDDGQVEYLDQEQNAQTQEPVPQDQEPLAVPDVPVAAPKPTKPVTPPRETLQKRPLTNALKSVGVKPGSPLAVELEARGINARTAPGLFKATGHTDWDNLPASEWGDYARVIGEDGNGYLSRDGLIQAVEGEMRGEPVQVGNQIALQEAKDLREYAQEFGRDDDVEIDLSDVPEARSYIPVRDEDISTPTERAQWVRRDIDAALSVTNMKDIITPAEYAELYDGLEANGGNAEDMLWGIILRSVDSVADESTFAATRISRDGAQAGAGQANPPAVRQGLGRQVGQSGAESRGAARDANAQGADGRTPQAQGAVDGRSLSNGEVPKRGNQADAAIIGDGEAAPTSAVSIPGTSAQDTADVAGNGLAVQPADAIPQAADVPQVAPDVATASKTLADARNAFNVLDQNKKIEDAQAYFAASSALSQARDGMADALAERGGRIELKSDKGLGAVITPRPDGKPGARITYFDGKGFSGDTSHDTLKAAVRDAIGQGYEIEAKGYLKNRQALWPKSKRVDVAETPPAQNTPAEGIKAAPEAQISEKMVKGLTRAAGDLGWPDNSLSSELMQAQRNGWIEFWKNPQNSTTRYFRLTDEGKRVLGNAPKQSAKTTSETAKTLPKANEGFVVRNKDTGEVVMETRDQAKVDALNTDKYEAVPVRQHLAELNDTNSKARKAAEDGGTSKTPVGSGTEAKGDKPFNASKFDADRNVAIEKSRADGYTHLDDLGATVEEMRGKKIEYVHNPNVKGVIRSVSNSGEVIVHWSDEASAEAEMAVQKQYGRKSVWESDLGPSDMKDYRIQGSAKPSTEQTEAGTQNVIPGAEQSTERSQKARDADRKREADVRAQQSKMRTGVPQDGPGGLFDTQGDMFDAPRQDATPAKPAQTGKIEDFGEKLEGAQKDKVKGWLDRAQEVADDEIVNVPLSKAWPEPDYQAMIDEGLDPEAVAFMHAARDEIPNKPRQKWKVERWADQVRLLREVTTDIASGKISMEKVNAKMPPKLLGFGGRVSLYEAYGHDKSLKDFKFGVASYTVFKGERFDKARKIWTVQHKGSVVAHGDTREAAIADFADAHADLGNLNERPKGTKFEIRKWRGGPVFIGKKVGKDWIEVETNPDWDWKEARAYLAENQEALEAKFQKMKELPPERGEDNSPRVGVDHRNGQDVTPEMFSETFGFRGVQFGNYVEGPRRQADLNEAYDGLMDLAGIINVPPKAMSLNGTLGLAFGARGSGRKAKAHYEPDMVVINLTKGSGAGSLAHEWWHGLDHYFAMQGGKKGTLLTETGGRGLNENIRPEVVAEFQNLITAVRQAELKVRSQQADKRKSKPYFSKMEEMTARAFESYVIGKLQDQSASNDYLANILSEDAWNALEAMAGQEKPSWPYVTVSEMPAFREAFDKLFDTIQTEETADGTVRMFRQPSAQDAATVEAALPDLRKRLNQMMLKRVSLEAVEGATFQGAFEARGGDLRILVGQTQDGMKTVNHEAVHALRNLNLFTDAEWDALSDQAVAEWLDKYDIASRYDDLNAEAQIEEAIAEAFADFVAEQTEPGPIKSAFAKMRRMFRALKEWVTGNPSVQGVFEAVDSGRVGGRQSQGGTDTRALQKQINTATEAFKRWFGDSKVVDADGKPLVVYHGTDADTSSDFAFRTQGKGVVSTTFGSFETERVGSFFTPDQDFAGEFGENIEPFYLSLQNPARIDPLFPQSDEGNLVWNFANTFDPFGPDRNLWLDARNAQSAWALLDGDLGPRFREYLENEGYDGVILNEETGEGESGLSYVAFRPEQIKSVYNRGTFDPNDARIRYQRQATARQKAQETFDQMPRDVAVPNRAVFDELFARNRSMFQNIGQAKGAVGDRMDVAREYMQDRILPLRRVQEAIEREIGQPIAEEMNAYVKEETYHGKVGRRLEDIRQFTLEPISDLIAESDSLDAGKVNDYLTALHAEERNARIAKINPEMPDGGSGMSNAEAQKILKDAKLSKDYAALKEIARLVAKLRDDTLQLRVDAGLMTAKDAAILKAMYKNYVPLKGFEEFDGSGVLSDRPNVGRGYSVKGPETKRALGRKSRSFDVLANILSQAQEVAIRAEKNQIGKAVFDLASQYPSENIWRVREVETKRVFNKQTGLVETRSEAPTARALAENEMAVKIDGKEYRIEFMDERLTRAMGAVKVGQMGDLVRILSLPARYFSAVNTMIDPEFVVRNAFRDMQAAQINIRNFGEADRNRIAKGMIANWPKAFAAAFKGQGANKPDTEWTKWYREFEEAGAKVSFWKMEDADRMKSDLERQIFLKRGNIAKRAGKFAITPSAWFSAQDNAVLGFIERTNLAVDNAVRLAAYVEARKSGWSKQKAASLSKNLTVNFNRRGHYGPVMNALYPFYNAGMQGTQVLFRAMSNPKRMSKYVVGMIGVGFISDLINAAISDEDDDGVLAYDKIQKFKQEMSFQISTGDDVLTVPLSYGYNVFPYMGQLAGQVYRGVKAPDEAFIDFVDAAVSAFSPVYESDAMRTMLPMVMDLPYDLATNSDWLHRPIRPENPYGDYGPDAYKHYGGASEWAKEVADFANRATGGTIAEPGMIDVSPEYLDHIWGFASGGAGRFVSNTGDMAAKILSGKTDEIEGYRVPFARQVFSETGLFLDRDRYYRFREEVNEAAEARETAQEAGEPLSKLSYDLSKLKNEVKLADKVLRAIRKERAAVGDDATADQRKEWEAREAKAILRFNQKYVNIAGASIE